MKASVLISEPSFCGPKDDALTLAGVGASAFVSAMLVHEALGHAGVSALLREAAVVYPAWTQSASSDARMVAAGPLANLAAGGALLWASSRILPGAGRLFVWLAAAFNLLNFAGYLLLGAAANFGDWAALLAPAKPGTVFRVGLAAGAALLYYAFARALAATGAGYLGPARGRRLTVVPWAAAGAVACAAAAVSAQGFLPVAVAATASLAAGVALPAMHDWGRLHPERAAEPPVARSGAWIAFSLALVAFFVLIVGRGLHIPGRA